MEITDILKAVTYYSRLKEQEEMEVIQAVGHGKETVYISRKKLYSEVGFDVIENG